MRYVLYRPYAPAVFAFDPKDKPGQAEALAASDSLSKIKTLAAAWESWFTTSVYIYDSKDGLWLRPPFFNVGSDWVPNASVPGVMFYLVDPNKRI